MHSTSFRRAALFFDRFAKQLGVRFPRPAALHRRTTSRQDLGPPTEMVIPRLSLEIDDDHKLQQPISILFQGNL